MWPWQRGGAKTRAQHLAFDAVIDLGPEMAAGIAAEAAMTGVQAAVQALPGAGRIRVRVEAAVTAVRVFPPGKALERDGAGWAALRDRVAAAVRGALPPPARPKGFAEAPAGLDALAALAALAAHTQGMRTQPAAPPLPGKDPGDTDIRLLARLLGLVLPAEDRATATVAVRRFGSFAAVLAAPASELRGIPGLGPHSIAAIKLVHEAATRLARAGLTGQPVLDDRAALSAYLAAAVGRERVEQFRILFLDERGMLRADEVQARGTVNHTPVYPREIMRRALELQAAAVILVHNHPSGDPTPSPEDIAMTEEIARAAMAVGVDLRDHIIVGNGRTLSFRDEGLI